MQVATSKSELSGMWSRVKGSFQGAIAISTACISAIKETIYPLHPHPLATANAIMALTDSIWDEE